jgi:hypothetical protein
MKEQKNPGTNDLWFEEQYIRINKELHRISDEQWEFLCHMGRCEELAEQIMQWDFDDKIQAACITLSEHITQLKGYGIRAYADLEEQLQKQEKGYINQSN